MTQTPDFSLLDASLVTLSVLLVIWLLRPAVKNSAFWQATVTPLASIIGSGFLVVVPLLANIAGHWAWLAIILIVLLSWWLGSAMRYSMQASSLNQDAPDKWLMGLERFADIAFYYLLQSLLAARQSALREHAPKRVASYLGLAFIMLLIVVFAESVEGH